MSRDYFPLMPGGIGPSTPEDNYVGELYQELNILWTGYDGKTSPLSSLDDRRLLNILRAYEWADDMSLPLLRNIQSEVIYRGLSPLPSYTSREQALAIRQISKLWVAWPKLEAALVAETKIFCNDILDGKPVHLTQKSNTQDDIVNLMLTFKKYFDACQPESVKQVLAVLNKWKKKFKI